MAEEMGLFTPFRDKLEAAADARKWSEGQGLDGNIAPRHIAYVTECEDSYPAATLPDP